MAKKEPNFVKFIMHKTQNAEFYFNAYRDEEENVVYLKVGVNDNGKDLRGKIRFPKNKRIIQFPHNKKDVNGKYFAEFVENSPYCKGSALCGDGEGMFFKFDPQRDAKIELEEARIRRRAENHALEVTGGDLMALGAYCGLHNEDDEDVIRNAVFSFAKMKPVEYIEIANAPELSILALVKSCEQFGIIKRRGFAYETETKTGTLYLGKNVEEIVLKLRDDEKMTEVFIAQVEQSKKKS